MSSDPKAVVEAMKEKGALARLNRDPKARRRFAEMFAERGWLPEPGRSCLATAYGYLQAADSTSLNSEREVFGQKFDDATIRRGMAEALNLTSGEVGRMISDADRVAISDGVLERMLKRDNLARERPLSPEAVDSAQLRNTLAYHLPEDEPSKVTAPGREASPEPGSRGRLADVAAAFDHHTKSEE